MGFVGHQIPLPGKNGPFIFDGVIHRRRGPQSVKGSEKIKLTHILRGHAVVLQAGWIGVDHIAFGIGDGNFGKAVF